METIDDGGEWWLPERPDRKVSGWLTYSVDDGARRRLIGSLRDLEDEGVARGAGVMAMTTESLERAGRYPRILGQIGSRAITLEGCFRTRLDRNLFGGLPVETINVDRVYRGTWYEPGEDACGDGIALRLAHLVYWVRPATISEVWRWPPDGGDQPMKQPRVELAANDLPDVVLERPEGTFKMSQTLGLADDCIAGRRITQDIAIRLDTDGIRPSRELLRAVGAVQDVVSLGLDRIACIEAVSIFHPDVADHRRGAERREPIEMFARWSDRSAWIEPKDLVTRDLLFHFEDVGADGLDRLLDAAAKYRAELRRVMATRRERSMFNSDRLLNRCAALESFDRVRRDPEGGFRTRMQACAALAGGPFTQLVVDVEAWIELLRRRRNQVAHDLEAGEDDEGLVDLLMAESVYFLFAMCFMREAGVPASLLDRLKDNARIGWLRGQLAVVLRPE